MYLSIVGAIITIAFNYLLIPKIGFMASAWATLAAYGVMMLLSFYFGQKYYPVPYNLKVIIFFMLLAIIFSVIALNTNNNYYLNTVLVLLFLGIAAISERQQLKQFLKI